MDRFVYDQLTEWGFLRPVTVSVALETAKRPTPTTTSTLTFDQFSSECLELGCSGSVTYRNVIAALTEELTLRAIPVPSILPTVAASTQPSGDVTATGTSDDDNSANARVPQNASTTAASFLSAIVRALRNGLPGACLLHGTLMDDNAVVLIDANAEARAELLHWLVSEVTVNRLLERARYSGDQTPFLPISAKAAGDGTDQAAPLPAKGRGKLSQPPRSGAAAGVPPPQAGRTPAQPSTMVSVLPAEQHHLMAARYSRLFPAATTELELQSAALELLDRAAAFESPTAPTPAIVAAATPACSLIAPAVSLQSVTPGEQVALEEACLILADECRVRQQICLERFRQTVDTFSASEDMALDKASILQLGRQAADQVAASARRRLEEHLGRASAASRLANFSLAELLSLSSKVSATPVTFTLRSAKIKAVPDRGGRVNTHNFDVKVDQAVRRADAAMHDNHRRSQQEKDTARHAMAVDARQGVGLAAATTSTPAPNSSSFQQTAAAVRGGRGGKWSR